MKPKPIYVEIRIRSDMDELWRRTQSPELHERWDLRFTEIRYLPRPDPDQPQRFLYATRIGLGMNIAGEGESIGENNGPAGRTSALKFWSHDAKSLISEGSGYWKYVPTDDGIRFVTRYDYRTRFGLAGAMFDRFLFRPLLGWATAWSFDRLRLWIERGLAPNDVMNRSISHAIARTALALIWIYQGLVPKMLFFNRSGEIDTLRAMGIFAGHERVGLLIVGMVEIAFGIALLVFWRLRLLLLLNVIAMVGLLVIVALGRPILLGEQFNPATLNLAMAALGLIGWMMQRDLPSASNCLRLPPGGDS